MTQFFGWTVIAGLCHQARMATSHSKSWHWQAIDPSRNVARDYFLWLETDLFGWTTVERRWGRIGTKGQGIIISFADNDHADRMAQQVRKRRKSAFHRIGVCYYEAE